MSKSRTKDKIFVLFGGALLCSIVVLSWIPSSCPKMRQWLIGCANPKVSEPAKDANYIERNRYANQEITSDLAMFDITPTDVKFGEKPGKVTVRFALWPDPDQPAMIQAKMLDGYRDIALVSHPFINSVNAWPVIKNEPLYLYQKDGDFGSIEEFKKKLPDPSLIAADRPAAQLLNLENKQFTALDLNTDLQKLANIKYVLTTYPAPTIDGQWQNFEYIIDASKVPLDYKGNQAWAISFPGSNKRASKTYLGTVHFDYMKSSSN